MKGMVDSRENEVLNPSHFFDSGINRRRFRSIDNCLGRAEGRFLGSGYRKVEHYINDIRVNGEDECAGARAVATVGYPVDWSYKSGNVDLRPHLSSVDAMILGLQLVEAYLTHTHSLNGMQRRRMWPRRIILTAGCSPQENLHRFDIDVVRVAAATGTICRNSSRLRASLGTMKLDCDIEHDGIGREDEAGSYHEISDLLGALERQCLGAGSRSRRLAISDVDIDITGGTADATVLVEASGCERFDAGMGAAYQPSLTAIDCLLALAQLTQAFVYQMDGIDRSESNTLWLRRLDMEVAGPRQRLSGRHQAWIGIDEGKILSLRGQPWRKASVTGGLGGIKATLSVAHQLPDTATRLASRRWDHESRHFGHLFVW